MRLYDRFPRYATAALAVMLMAGCTDAPRPVLAEFGGMTMGTSFTVKVVTPGGVADMGRLQRTVDQRLREIDQRMSTYIPDSELSRLNHNRDPGWIDLSPELHEVIRLALDISALTGGAFDITIGPVVNLWGFGPDAATRHVPDPETLRAIRDRTGFDKLQLAHGRPALRKHLPEIYIDLSGIAKGYGVDAVATSLEANGIGSYMVEVGGEVRARGYNVAGRPWQIGIEQPLTGSRAVERVVALHDMAMATSGDYRNYFEEGGVRYSHIVDPVSGTPIRHRLASVTVLDTAATRADALATALLVLGPDAGPTLAEREGIPAFFIIRAGDGFEDHWTSHMQRWFSD